MKIAIVGYGKMGHMIEKAALSMGHEVAAVIDPFVVDEKVTAKGVSVEALKGVDCVIDFSSPAGIMDNLFFYAENSIDAVIGTTGWYDKLPLLKEKAAGRKGRIIWSGNFSLGVACTLEIVRRAGALFNKVAGYDVAVHEIHHCHKMDAPSGTGIMLADVLIEEMDKKDSITQNPNAKPNEISVTSQRIGENPGNHTVTFDSFEDTITINHAARTREGFAKGSVKAAEWVLGKEPGVYAMADFLAEFFAE